LFECKDLATAVLLLVAAFYIFNLSYNAKAVNFYKFIQEKVIGIPSDKLDKVKSPVALSHISGICRAYNSLSKEDSTEEL